MSYCPNWSTLKNKYKISWLRRRTEAGGLVEITGGSTLHSPWQISCTKHCWLHLQDIQLPGVLQARHAEGTSFLSPLNTSRRLPSSPPLACTSSSVCPLASGTLATPSKGWRISFLVILHFVLFKWMPYWSSARTLERVFSSVRRSMDSPLAFPSVSLLSQRFSF